MKAIVYAVLAPTVYALGSVLIEHRFSKNNNLTVMLVYLPIMLICAFAFREMTKTASPTYFFPQGKDLWWLIGLGVIFFTADFFYIGAYTNGGDITTIALITLCFPVLVSLMKLAGSKFIEGMHHTAPNSWQLLGYGFMILAVLCIIKGAPTK